MGEGMRTLVVALVAGVVSAVPARGEVTLTATRTEVLYSADSKPDCSTLFKTTDDALPFNVSRIRAVVSGAPAGVALGYHWSVTGEAGIVAADLDLGPEDETPTLIGMCGSFGNACILTTDRLRFYSEPSILWLGPTCDALPKDTSKPFHGGKSRLTVKVTAGKKKVGRASTDVGWGRTGSITLYVDGQDGIGKKGGIGTGVAPFFGAVVDPASVVPTQLDTFEFANGAGTVADVSPGCFETLNGRRFDGCIDGETYTGAGAFTATVKAKYHDGSALCDNAALRVLSCSADSRLNVAATPKLGLYDPDDAKRNTVEVVVKLENHSKATASLPPCSLLLAGAGILTCTESLKVGGTEDKKTTAFDLPHCSSASNVQCTSDADCHPPFCPECTADEVCLLKSHCSKTFAQLCTSDAACDRTVCPSCVEDEKCIRVLDFQGASAVVIEPGKSFELLRETVQLKNEFADTARLTDDWEANTVNAGSADKTLKYRLRGRPALK